MKQLMEFNTLKKGKAFLEVQCTELESEELEELISFLKAKGFKLIDKTEDSLWARLEGEYKDVYDKVDDLTKQGFHWTEEAMKAEQQGLFATRKEFDKASQEDQSQVRKIPFRQD